MHIAQFRLGLFSALLLIGALSVHGQETCYEDVFVTMPWVGGCITQEFIDAVSGPIPCIGLNQARDRPKFYSHVVTSSYYTDRKLYWYGGNSQWVLTGKTVSLLPSSASSWKAEFLFSVRSDAELPPSDGWECEQLWITTYDALGTPSYCGGRSPSFTVRLTGGEPCGREDPAISLRKEFAPRDYVSGDPITYLFTVTNSGGANLINIEVSDTTLDCTVSLDKPSLGPGESAHGAVAHVLRMSETDAGWFENHATVRAETSEGEVVTAEAEARVLVHSAPSIKLDKVSTAPQGHAGGTVTYSVTVTNTGDVTLYDVKAYDRTLDAPIPLNKTTLEPGESASGTISYTLTQADVDASDLKNVAEVTARTDDGQAVKDTARTTTRFPAAPSLHLVKSATEGPFTVGDTVRYTFTVTNTGNVTLTDVDLADTGLGRNVALTVSSLTPGSKTSASVDYTVTEEDAVAGRFTNRAEVTARAPDGQKVADTDDETIICFSLPSLRLDKSASPGPFSVGDTVRYTFTVTNTGNVALTDVELTDTGLGRGVTLPASSLRPGASTSASLDYTVTGENGTAGSFSNRAEATAKAADGQRVADTDETRILCISPTPDEEEGPPPEPAPPMPEQEEQEEAQDEEAEEVVEPLVITIHVVGPLGQSDVDSFCQGDPITVNVVATTTAGVIAEDVLVYATLYALTDSERDSVGVARALLDDGSYNATFDTTLLDAGNYELKVRIVGGETERRPFALLACGDNPDGDGVSDALDACPDVAGIAENAGCRRDDLNHNGVPDREECDAESLVEGAYPVLLRVETSSDWTTVSLENGELLLLDAERQGWPLVGWTGLLDMRLYRPCCVKNTVAALFNAYIFGLGGKDPQWTIEKGSEGRSALEVYAYPETDEFAPEPVLVTRIESTKAVSEGQNAPAREETMPTEDLAAASVPITLKEACDARKVEPLVLALYYPWYDAPADRKAPWTGWQRGPQDYGAVDTPVGGPYTSLDPAVIERHMTLARDAGVDALVCWWTGIGSIEDRAIPALLDAAQVAGLKVAFHYWLDSSWYLLADYRYIDEQYGAHPALLRVGDEPVVFLPLSPTRQRGDPWHVWVSLSEGLGLPGFWVLDGVFLPEARFLDGLTLDTLSPGFNETYDLTLVDEKLERASLLAHAQGGISVATVYPGGEGWYATQEPLVVSRRNGETYETLWAAAASSDADWILIRSFNQWLEGTEIEPSVEYGITYIEMTRRFADEWKAQKREEASP